VVLVELVTGYGAPPAGVHTGELITVTTISAARIRSFCRRSPVAEIQMGDGRQCGYLPGDGRSGGRRGHARSTRGDFVRVRPIFPGLTRVFPGPPQHCARGCPTAAALACPGEDASL